MKKILALLLVLLLLFVACSQKVDYSKKYIIEETSDLTVVGYIPDGNSELSLFRNFIKTVDYIMKNDIKKSKKDVMFISYTTKGQEFIPAYVLYFKEFDYNNWAGINHDFDKEDREYKNFVMNASHRKINGDYQQQLEDRYGIKPLDINPPEFLKQAYFDALTVDFFTEKYPDFTKRK